MNRSYYFSYIDEKLHVLAYRIETNGKLNMLNLHLHSENFYMHFLNLLYGFQLKNLNGTIQNVEAIDLIDDDNKLIVQVSATATKRKVEDSLSKESIGEYADYNFFFISLSKDTSKLRKLNFKNPFSISFDPELNIFDITSILRKVSELTAPQQEEIYKFIKNELGGSEVETFSKRTLTGELVGVGDPRLQPREGEIVGRENEVMNVVAFLEGDSASAAVCGHITGTAGIGKTEVCKAALKQWLSHPSATRAFFIKLRDDASPEVLLDQIAESIDLSTEARASIKNVDQLSNYLPSGLYYLDNLEGVAEADGGINVLRQLSQIPGVRLLASSRLSLDGVLGKGIELDRLDSSSSTELFLKCWSGKNIPDENEVSTFVEEQLGGHALSITLMARLGRAYSWERLNELWHEKGTALAAARSAEDQRLDSLDLSLKLTQDALAPVSGALDLWQFAALFPEGFDEDTLSLWESISGFDQARLALADYHILNISAERITMLPPVARYALGVNRRVFTLEQTTRSQNLAKLGVDSYDIFSTNWISAKKIAYQYFENIIRNSKRERGIDGVFEAKLDAQLVAIEQLMLRDFKSETPEIDIIVEITRDLRDAFNRNTLKGWGILKLVHSWVTDGNVTYTLARMEDRLGNRDEARGLYKKAMQHYTEKGDKFGMASVYVSTGEWWARAGDINLAIIDLRKGLELYRNNNFKNGFAHALCTLAEAEIRLGSTEEARRLFSESLKIYEGDNDFEGVGRCYSGLGDYYYREEIFDQAIMKYREALDIYMKKGGGIIGLAYSYRNIGIVLLSMDDPYNALIEFEKSLKLFEEIHIPGEMDVTYGCMVACYFKSYGWPSPELDAFVIKAIGETKKVGLSLSNSYIKESLTACFDGDPGKMESYCDSLGCT
jgi:tetratricopeptide (TPR) repeat protein